MTGDEKNRLLKMAEKLGDVQASGASAYYAWREQNGQIDLDSISETKEGVRIKYLESCMGWRFKYPDRYSYDDEWERLQEFGSVVQVSVSVVDA